MPIGSPSSACSSRGIASVIAASARAPGGTSHSRRRTRWVTSSRIHAVARIARRYRTRVRERTRELPGPSPSPHIVSHRRRTASHADDRARSSTRRSKLVTMQHAKRDGPRHRGGVRQRGKGAGARPFATCRATPVRRAEPITSPRVFAPGVISTADPEFAIAFAADGTDGLLRSRERRSQQARRSCVGVRERRVAAGKRRCRSRRASFATSIRSSPATGCTSARTGPRPAARSRDRLRHLVRDAPARTWSEPVHVDGAPSGPGNELYVSIARDGTLYFQSDATGGGDIYRAPRVGDAYPAAAPLEAITTPASEATRRSRPTARSSCSSSEREVALGGADLYASRAATARGRPRRTSARRRIRRSPTSRPRSAPTASTCSSRRNDPGIAPAPASGRPPGDIYQIDVASLGL